jgi:hypothetical protein
MICTTIKQGMECPFMSKSGCSYNGGICQVVAPTTAGFAMRSLSNAAAAIVGPSFHRAGFAQPVLIHL